MIVVFDASTLVSATFRDDSIPGRAFARAVDESNTLLLSQEVEDEYRDVLSRPKFDRYVSIERRQRILDIIMMSAATIEPTELVRECIDPKDDKYLTLAAAGKADVIMSSDVHHLLSMHPWRGIRFCHRRTFSQSNRR